MSPNDDQFREIMIRENATENKDRENQHKERQIQDGDQAVSRHAALNHDMNDQAVTRDPSASQKQLFSECVETNMTTNKSKHISAYPKTSKEIIYDEREKKPYGYHRQHKRTDKGMEYRRNNLEEKSGKLHSRLLQNSSAIDALLYSFQNKNMVRAELHRFDDQFKMILEVREEYDQLIEDKVKQKENEVWFNKLDENCVPSSTRCRTS